MGPNTILQKKYHKTSSKCNKKNSQHTILKKFGGPLAITVHYTAQFNLECCKSAIPDMCPNTILKIKKYISNDILKVK